MAAAHLDRELIAILPRDRRRLTRRRETPASAD
jgi:hypothetical protein